MQTAGENPENIAELEKGSEPKIMAADYVLISKCRKAFKRGYEANFTDKMFILLTFIKSDPLSYEIVDNKDNKILVPFIEITYQY